MSRQARTRSSLALGLVLFVCAALWIAGKQLASAGETPSARGGKAHASLGDTTAASAAVTKAAVLPLPVDFRVKLIRAGLDPHALCAAGVSSNSILATLQAAADSMNQSPNALSSADATYVSARQAADALLRRLQSGLATQEEFSSYPAAQSALQAADAARASVLDSFFAAAIQNLSNPQRLALGSIRANSTWGLPAEYMVVTRTEAQWVALREALSNERIAEELPGTLNQAAQSLLSTVRADGSVSAALTAIQQNLTSVTSAWNTAAGD